MPISQDDFLTALKGDSQHQNDTNHWAIGRSPELCRIFNAFLEIKNTSGPTLDIGSGGGSFYRPIKKFTPHLLPYSYTDLNAKPEHIDGELVQAYSFECDKDTLPIESQQIGVVLLCDVLEHLLIDPVWTLLEINRVLRIGGHLVISTPNVTSIRRAISIFNCEHPGTEHHFKPTSIFDRHNREWTPFEIIYSLQGIGFTPQYYDSNLEGLTANEFTLLQKFQEAGLLKFQNIYYGPDLTIIFEKTEHLTLDTDLPADKRWPQFLYTGYDSYRRRPEVFPSLKSK